MKEEKYILSIDQSTQGTKAMLFDRQGDLLFRCDRKHRQIITEEGWVEHDPIEIFENTLLVVKDLIAKSGVDPAQVVGAGISNQRETVVAWDRKTGQPKYNAIVWQCGRATAQCERVTDHAAEIQQITGLPLSPYFSAAKASWLLDHLEGARQDPDFAIGTIDSWLLFRLTGRHLTDYSNAARTQLFDIHQLCWSRPVCELFAIPQRMLAQIVDSDAVFGSSDFGGVFPHPIPIRAVLGDSNGALLGQGCFAPGQTKATFGTGSSVMMNAGPRFPGVSSAVATSLAWKLNGKLNYVLEGNINYTGAIITWLCEDIKLIESPKECSQLAFAAREDDHTYLVPAFSGLGAPYWNSHARASFYGMSRTTGKAELVRAAEQAIAYQICDVAQSLKAASGFELSTLCADGGPTRDAYLMQFQSDLLNAPVTVSGMEELSGAGAAFAAGQALGLFTVEQAAGRLQRRIYQPQMPPEKRQALLQGWEKAVQSVLK